MFCELFFANSSTRIFGGLRGAVETLRSLELLLTNC